MSMLGSDEKITCSICGEIILVLKVKEHVFECVGTK